METPAYFDVCSRQIQIRPQNHHDRILMAGVAATSYRKIPHWSLAGNADAPYDDSQ